MRVSRAECAGDDQRLCCRSAEYKFHTHLDLHVSRTNRRQSGGTLVMFALWEILYSTLYFPIFILLYFQSLFKLPIFQKIWLSADTNRFLKITESCPCVPVEPQLLNVVWLYWQIAVVISCAATQFPWQLRKTIKVSSSGLDVFSWNLVVRLAREWAHHASLIQHFCDVLWNPVGCFWLIVWWDGVCWQCSPSVCLCGAVSITQF